MLKNQLYQAGIVILCLVALSAGCQHAPRGNWQIEMGRARVVNDLGERQPRIEVVAEARHDAQLKLLRDVKAMPEGSHFVGDYMQQNALLGTRIRSLILSAREFDKRYTEDGAVEVDMGINLDEVRRIVREARP